MKTSFRLLFAMLLSSTSLFVSCKEKEKPVTAPPDAAVVAAPASAAPVDPMQCPGCQLAPQPAWTFEGLYRDAACTDPIAQIVAAACSVVPGFGQTNLTYVDEVGVRKAGESTTVTIGEQVPPDAIRYRKSGTKCIRANEGGVDVTPAGCSGQRVCRDANAALTCGTCRTFASGCADYEETRLYGTIVDPGLKTRPAGGGGGGGNLAACCAAIAAQARQLGNSPEAGVLNGAAAQCSAILASANGNTPEVGALRTMLAGRSIPGCNL